MVEWFADNAWAAWLALALILGTVEVMTLDLTFLMLAGGAAVGAVAAAFGAPVVLAALLAIVSCAALLGVVRPVALRHLNQPAIARTGVAALIGNQALVLERVDQHHGSVKLGGEVWTARAYAAGTVIEPGATVDVIEIKGATALVYPAED